MFRTGQMLTASELVRNFPRVSNYLRRAPQALLITQKTGEHLVLVNADIFEELLAERLQMTSELKSQGDIRMALTAQF